MAYKLVFIIWSFDFLKSLEFRRFNAFGSKKYIKTIILWIINIINILFCIWIYFKCKLLLWHKAEFSASLLRCHMILQKSF